MKKIITLFLSLFFFGSLLTSQGQDIALSATLSGIAYPLSNNSSTTSPVPFSSSLGTFSFTISNTASSGNLTLTQTSGKYLQLSGTGIDDFNIDESAITGTLAPSASVSVSVSLKTTAPAGTRTITVVLNSNDPDENPFTASLTYTVNVPNMIVTTGSLTLVTGGSTNYPTTINQSSFSFDINIANSGGNAPLILSQQNCPSSCAYFVLSGAGVNDFTINESTVPATLANNNSFNVTVTANPTAPNGSRSITVTFLNNDPDQNTYTHTINYTFNNPSLNIQSAKDAGIAVFPSPSTDGQLHITAPTFTVNKIELINAVGLTETVSTLDFQTNLKGIVTVLIYTDKGIFREKIVLQ
jgi:hypothetical protein